ncbi:hypothetical protein BH24ACT10_BH24ACT10_19320 [soil metagenome]
MTSRVSPRLDAFEARLLTELTAVVNAQASATRPAPSVRAGQRRRRPWYLPVAGAAAAAAVAIAVGSTVVRPTPAYAVSGGNGEEITVTVTRLEGAEALQAALLERGVPADITYLPTGKACQPGRSAEIDTPGLSLVVGADLFEVTIPPGSVGPGDTFVLSAAVTPIDEGVRATVDFGVAQGAVAPCTVVDAS